MERIYSYLANPLTFAQLTTKHAWDWGSIDPWQRKVLESTRRYLLLNCSRQSGKSTILMVKACWLALNHPNALILVVAEQRQSNEDIRRSRDLLVSLDRYLKAKHDLEVGLVTDNKTSIEVGNGSRIIALPGNEKVRGYSAPQLVIIDEAAYLDDEVFVGIDPMMEVSQGQLIIASTPSGTGGFFARESGNPRYEKIEVPWWDCPRIQKESIDQKRLVYGDAYVDQEYCCKFLDDLSALFTDRALKASLDEEEEVFDDAMRNIHKVLQGDVQLI